MANKSHGEQDLLRLIVEIKGYRREDAKDKKSTMEILGEIKIKAGVPLDIECMRELQEQLPGAGVTGGGAFPEGGPLEIKRGLDVVHISLDRNAATTVTVSFKWLGRSRVEESGVRSTPR